MFAPHDLLFAQRMRGSEVYTVACGICCNMWQLCVRRAAPPAGHQRVLCAPYRGLLAQGVVIDVYSGVLNVTLALVRGWHDDGACG